MASFFSQLVQKIEKMLAQHLLDNIPLASYICEILHQRLDHNAPFLRFKTQLGDTLSSEDATITLKSIIGLGRYAEIFSYGNNEKGFSLDIQQLESRIVYIV